MSESTYGESTYGDESNVDCPACGRNICIQDLTTDGCLEEGVAGMTQLVLSLFPGIGLLDMAFEEEGFCVVRGPDLLWGGDIRRFHPPAGRFDGVIGGPPCQAFSPASGGQSCAENLIPEYERVVTEAHPAWWLMENVRQAPLTCIEGYTSTERLLNNRWLGEEQSRLRRFGFGSSYATVAAFNSAWSATPLALDNPVKEGCFTANGTQWEPGRDTNRGRMRGRLRSKRTMPEFRRGCRLQGLPPDFLDAAPFTVAGKIKVVGNGVPLPMGRAVARAVKRALGLERAHDAGAGGGT